MIKIWIPRGIWFLTAIVMFPAGMALGTAWHGAVLLPGNFGSVHVSDLFTFQSEKLIVSLWKINMDPDNYLFLRWKFIFQPLSAMVYANFTGGYRFFWPLPIFSKGIWSWELHDYAAVSAGSRQRGISSNGYKSTVLSNVEEKGQTSGGFHICSAKTYESIPIQPSCLPFKYNGYTQLLDNPIWITCENPQVLQGCPMDRCLILPETGSELKTGSRRNTNSAWHILPKE